MKQKEFYDLAAQMEEKCGDWENSKGLSDEVRAKLLAKVEAMDRESRKTTSEKPIPFRRKKRYILVLAAALVLMMGMGVVGDRAWIAGSSDLERESEVTTKVDNEDKVDILKEEEEIYQEIAEKLGIAPMRLGYKPEGMVLDSYTIIEDTGWAHLNYLYEEKLISVQMTKRSKESSSNIQWDGNSQKVENVQNKYGHQIEAYCMDVDNKNYSASLTYGNGYYNILGRFSSEDVFLKILNGIYFKNM